MTLYINTDTLEVYSEYEIRTKNPNTSFATPFAFEGYAQIFDAPQPTYDIYSQLTRLLFPVLTNNGIWERAWEIYNLSGDDLIAAQNRKLEDEKAKIKSDIAALEATITPRRTREAILAIDTTWLSEQEAAIALLRTQL